MNFYRGYLMRQIIKTLCEGIAAFKIIIKCKSLKK